jgi:hypothetical protein
MAIDGIRSIGVRPPSPAVPPAAEAQPARLETSSQSSGRPPYLSPVLQYDSDAAVAVLIFRDPGSGTIERQIPSKQVVREYQLRGRESLIGDALAAAVEGPVNAIQPASATAAASQTGSLATAVASITASAPIVASATPPAPAATATPATASASAAVNLVA